MAASKRPRVTLSNLDHRVGGLDHRMRDFDDRLRGQGIILEEIRSQNRATIEAVEAFRVALEAKIEQVDRDNGARNDLIEAAVRQNSTDIRKNSKDIRKNGEDIRVLTGRVDALGPLDQRVSALERRQGAG